MASAVALEESSLFRLLTSGDGCRIDDAHRLLPQQMGDSANFSQSCRSLPQCSFLWVPFFILPPSFASNESKGLFGQICASIVLKFSGLPCSRRGKSGSSWNLQLSFKEVLIVFLLYVDIFTFRLSNSYKHFLARLPWRAVKRKKNPFRPAQVAAVVVLCSSPLGESNEWSDSLAQLRT